MNDPKTPVPPEEILHTLSVVRYCMEPPLPVRVSEQVESALQRLYYLEVHGNAQGRVAAHKVVSQALKETQDLAAEVRLLKNGHSQARTQEHQARRELESQLQGIVARLTALEKPMPREEALSLLKASALADPMSRYPRWEDLLAELFHAHGYGSVRGELDSLMDQAGASESA